MTYTARWDPNSFQMRTNPYDLPWVRALSEAHDEAYRAAWREVLAAHQDEFRHRFDDEMDRRHAQIVEKFGAELERLRDDPMFWLRLPVEAAEAS